MSAWLGKPCANCGGKKGRAYARTKLCGNCVAKQRKDSREAQWAARILRVYGITARDYYDLLKFQGGACYLCQRAKGVSVKLCIDHDHRTGEVRGLLCKACNKIVGHARDDAGFFDRGMTYLVTPPFKRMREAA